MAENLPREFAEIRYAIGNCHEGEYGACVFDSHVRCSQVQKTHQFEPDISLVQTDLQNSPCLDFLYKYYTNMIQMHIYIFDSLPENKSQLF